MNFSKNVNNKNHASKLIFLNEKKKIEKDSDNFWRRKFTLKVRNQDFSIATCQMYVDLPREFFYGKVLFFTKLSCHLMWKLLKKSWMVSIIYILRLSVADSVPIQFMTDSSASYAYLDVQSNVSTSWFVTKQ